MDNLNNEYTKIETELTSVTEQINTLEKNETVKEYIKLLNKKESLAKEKLNIYTQLKNTEFSCCNHIWIKSSIIQDGWESRHEVYYGCIKCGLNEYVKRLIREGTLNFDLLTIDQKIMYDFMQNNIYRKGKYLNKICDLNLGKAIYAKIKENHPEIDDDTATKYFVVALDNMQNIKVNKKRKNSRAKRLLLNPNSME